MGGKPSGAGRGADPERSRYSAVRSSAAPGRVAVNLAFLLCTRLWWRPGRRATAAVSAAIAEPRSETMPTTTEIARTALRISTTLMTVSLVDE